MLSYRHAFHAGNHGDVLKHFIQIQLLRYLGQKAKPLWYIDSHAGAGLYSLTQGYATKTAEFKAGIQRLWQRDDLPPAVADYVQTVKSFNKTKDLTSYPGSPKIAETLARAEDRLHLFELHPGDFRLLRDNFAHPAVKSSCLQQDGLKGLKALLPPAPRRALVMIDPPYEDKQEYKNVVSALQDSLKRFATGTYAIWYPLLQRREVTQFVRDLDALPCSSRLNVTLTVATPRPDGFGMHGSGMYIINPPWTLADTLKTEMPWLTDALAEDPGATFTLESGQ